MATASERVEDLMNVLERQRDELRLKLSLAKAEVREEWDKLEGRWHKVKGKLESAADEAGDAAEDVGEAAKLLLEEIREGYDRIRRSL